MLNKMNILFHKSKLRLFLSLTAGKKIMNKNYENLNFAISD